MLERNITVDFSKKIGKIKPVCGVNSGPLFSHDLSVDLSQEYREIGVPMVRFSDTGMPEGGGRFLDIHNIFPVPELDERFEGSYFFGPTDAMLSAAKAAGADIYLRLGESPEHCGVNRYTRPTVTAEKWARIAEKIILHYNKGWCSGMKLGIKYIEIWPYADRAEGWSGTPREYYEFYRTVAVYLKGKFPTLKIGGYSSGGFSALNNFAVSDEEKSYITFLEGFLSYISKEETRAPLDFLSWECEAETPEELSLHRNYAASYLQGYKQKKAISVVSRFSLKPRTEEPLILSKTYPAELASALIIAEKCGIDLLFFDSMNPYSDKNTLLSLDDRHTPHKYAAYHAFMAFARVASLGNAVLTTDDFRRELYTLGATDGESGALLVVTREMSGAVEITVSGAEFSHYSVLGLAGGGTRGVGRSKEIKNIPLGRGVITLRTGKCEVYLITFAK